MMPASRGKIYYVKLASIFLTKWLDKGQNMTDERQRIEQAIAALESQREILGDAVVDAALATMRDKLAEFEKPEQQRKLVTILFTDIVGSTDIVKHLDPEDALEIMDGSLKLLAVPVEEHGGHIARFTGDGFKAVFGAPVAHENDPEMAIRAGLGILEKASEYAEELKKQWGIEDFQVRVGVNTGLAALGGMTEAEDTVMGSTVNLAKRIESAAPPGGLLISHNTYRHVRGVFDVQPREPIEAKGFAEPVQVYLVQGVKPRAFKVQTRGVEGVETRMVGRNVELLALQEGYRNAIEGEQIQVITVIGEAGVGKSRLLYEFQNWLELLPDVARFFQGRGGQETQNLPYALLKDLFTFRFQIQESDKAIEVHNKIEAGFGEVLGEDEEGQMRAHIIGQLLGFDFSESQNVKGILDDSQQIHDRALMYMGEFVQGMSEQAPVVLFLEDIHWADDSSLDMLNHLARRILEQQLLIVCVARHRLYERRPYWGEGLDYHTQLELRPLSNSKSRGLVKEILKKVDQVPKELQDLVVKGAEGNPFYIEELIKMLVEDGVILTGEEEWHIEPERLAEIEVPDTLTGVLQARLEGLPPEERTTLQQASVVGHIFWDDTVEYITTESSPADMQSALRIKDDILSSLRSRELIYHREESTFASVSEYTFKHAVLRDVTYESVLKRVRKAYHGLVAEWLIQHSGERADEYTGLIADHLELAGKDEQAAIYLYQAGEGAAKRYANSESVEYFTRALALTPEDDLVGRYDLLLAREKVLNIMGDRASEQKDLTALKDIAEDLEDVKRLAEVALCQIVYFDGISDYQSIDKIVTGAIEQTRAVGDLECEANLLLNWGRSLWQQGKSKSAIPILEAALVLAQTHHFHQLEAEILRNMGVAYDYVGDTVQFLTLTDRALQKYKQIGDRRGETFALNNLGVYFGITDFDFPRAKSYFEQTYHIMREIGDRSMEGLASYNLGGLILEINNIDQAIEWLSRSLDINLEVEDQHGLIGSYRYIGNSYFHLGEYDEAKKHFDQALYIAHEADIQISKAMLMGELVSFYNALGIYERAEAYHQQFILFWGEREYKFEEIKEWIRFGLLQHHMGDHQAALESIQQALSIMRDHGKHEYGPRGLTILGHALTALGRLSEAEQAYQKASDSGYATGRPRQSIEARAGLARVAVARGDTDLALIQVKEILAYMEANTPPKGSSHPLDGTQEPFRIYLTCCQVLKANNDPRAPIILTDAYNLLQTRAANISDEELRNCFLNNVAANREIVEEFKKPDSGGL